MPKSIRKTGDPIEIWLIHALGIMEKYITLNHGDLPADLLVNFPKDDFLAAYYRNQVERIVVWVVDRESNLQKEIEFDCLSRKILSKGERWRNIPPPMVEFFLSVNVRAIFSFLIDEKTDVLYKVFDVYEMDSPAKITRVEEVCFLPQPMEHEELIRMALKKSSFPGVYSAWSRDERINHWVGSIYRIRQQSAEGGGLEDNVFGQGLLTSMEKLEPKILSLIPFVLQKLALMEGIDKSKMFSEFRKRTGVVI